MNKYLQNLKNAFLHPPGNQGFCNPPKPGSRRAFMKRGEKIFGFTTVPALAGLGVGLLASALASALPVAIGVGVAVAVLGVPLTFSCAFAGAHTKTKSLALPYVAGLLTGQAVGFTLHSMMHPFELAREIVNGRPQPVAAAPQPVAIPVPPPAPPSAPKQADPDLKSSFAVAGVTVAAPSASPPRHRLEGCRP